MNTPARNRQQVRTLVDMTQIRQWHMYDPKLISARQHPDVAFCDVESLISSPIKSTSHRIETHHPVNSYVAVDIDESEEIFDDANTWLDEIPTSKTVYDSALDIEAGSFLYAPIVTRVLSDERDGAPGGFLDEMQEKHDDAAGELEDLDIARGDW